MALKSLTFTTLPSSKQNPVEDRRTNIIARLEEQKLLIGNPSYVRKEKHWTKADDGQRTQVEKQKRVHPWWRTAPDGSIVFFVRAAGKPLEFEKGKAGIAVTG